MTHFLAVDPSMSNTTFVWGVINQDKTISPIEYKVIHTEKSKAKVPVMVDRLNRISQIFLETKGVLDTVKPTVCFGELPSGSQSSSASIGIGVSLSVLSILPNLITVTPTDVKKVVGSGAISKDQVMEYCLSKYPDFNFEKKKDGSLVKARMEHVCDAIVIAEAAVKKGFSVPTKKVKASSRDIQMNIAKNNVGGYIGEALLEVERSRNAIYSPCKFGCKNVPY